MIKMLEFIKNLFKKEEIIEEEDVRLKDLESWLKDKTGKRFSEFRENSGLEFDQIKDIILQVRDSIELLKNADLQNKKIIHRAKQIMEGNRNTYIHRTNQFLGSIRIPEEISIEKTEEFVSSLELQLNNLNKSTIKSYYVLQEFFSQESKQIALKIKKIDNSVKSLKKIISRTDNDSINSAYEHIKELSKLKKSKKRGKEELDRLNHEKDLLMKSIDDQKSEIDELKQTKEFIDYQKLIEKKEEIKKKIYSLDSSISTRFSAIETALKKYERITTDEVLVSGLINNSTSTIRKTEIDQIMAILSKLKDATNQNQIMLKDKKRKKTLDTLQGMEKNIFTGYAAKRKELENQLSDADEKLKDSSIIDKYGQFKEKQETNKNKLSGLNDKMKDIESSVTKIGESHLKEKIEKNLKGLTNITVRIN